MTQGSRAMYHTTGRVCSAPILPRATRTVLFRAPTPPALSVHEQCEDLEVAGGQPAAGGQGIGGRGEGDHAHR